VPLGDVVSSPQRLRLLDLLFHELSSYFREASIVTQLPNGAWARPAFRFKPGAGFGLPVANLRAAYVEDGQSELVITADGRYGYWRDETYTDSELLLEADAVLAALDPRSSGLVR